MKRLPLQIIIIISIFLGLGSADRLFSDQKNLVSSHYVKKLFPLNIHVKTDKEIVKDIQNNHYLKPAIDDRLSSRILDNFIAELDPQKSLFLSSDIREFDYYRYRLDDALRSGDLKPAFYIYNRYQERVVERFVSMIKMVENNLARIRFDQNLSLDTDRKNDPWPKNRNELEQQWRKLVMNDLLNLMMDDKTLSEAGQALSKRYRSQLNRIGQTNSGDVFQIYMSAFTHTFDPHSDYFSPRTSENFNINMSLSLEGIGAMLGIDDEYVKVVSLIPAGPADKSGQLKPDDRIVAVGQGPDGDLVDVIGWRIDDVVDLIRGPRETVVRLKIIPANPLENRKTKIIQIVRNTVKLEEQAAHKEILDLGDKNRPRRIGIIVIPTFYLDFNALNSGRRDYKSTTRDVRELISELRQARVEGIVIDLRNNGGGSLQEAGTLTGLFIDSGPVVQIRDANNNVERLNDDDPQIFWDGPLAIVVNRLSASASEIVAGAIQDYGRGIIIGEDSFGKGTVQALMNLEYGQLKLTSAKFYRISGASTQNRGVIPDILYPSLYDKTKIGESSLEWALPWDTINGAPHRFYTEIRPHLPRLKEINKKRMASDPDYIYARDMVGYLAKIQAKKEISLNRMVRRQEEQQIRKKRLDLENTRRSLKGLPLLKNADGLTDEDEDNTREAKVKAQDDPVLVESARVIIDLVNFEAHSKSNRLNSSRK